MRYAHVVCALGLCASSVAAQAQDLITTRSLSMELASEIATQSVLACRKMGYQVSAVVVDRSGYEQVVMRDSLAARFTVQIAREKANLVVMSGIDSGALRKNREDIRQELNHIDGLIVMQGGVPIQAGGYMVGAVGVSGAPGGDKDEECAKLALKTVQERLEFAE